MTGGKRNAVTDRLLKQMISWNIIRSEDEDIYRFGLEGLLLKVVHYASYLLLAFLFREVVPFLIFFMAFLVLRKNAGGYHAGTRGLCYLFSCLTVLCALTVMKMISAWESTAIIAVTAVGLILAADLIICITAPVENKNRPLDDDDRNCFRRRCLIFLAVVNGFFWLLIALEKKTHASAIVLAVICEAMLLLLGRIQNGAVCREKK